MKAKKVQLSAEDTQIRILDAAEALVRRHGPEKTRVVDVARHLGMSHANVYRHFATKADIHDLIAERWLKRIAVPLAKIVGERGSAEQRLKKWLVALCAIKRRKMIDDPELFANYHALAEASRDVVVHHVTELRAQLAAIIMDGMRLGEFKVKDAGAAARVVYDATSRYHHPYFLRNPVDRTREVTQMVALLLPGLGAGIL